MDAARELRPWRRRLPLISISSAERTNMTATLSTDHLSALMNVHKAMGEIFGTNTNGGGVEIAHSYLKRVQKPATARHVPYRNYIKYPAPRGLRPRALTSFRVAALCKAYNFPTG